MRPDLSRCAHKLVLFELTTDGMKARSRGCPGNCNGGLSSFNDADGHFFPILASGSSVRWAMRACSDDTAGDSRTGGGARRAAPRRVTPLALIPWCYFVSIFNINSVLLAASG
jgi:hypothetical protein